MITLAFGHHNLPSFVKVEFDSEHLMNPAAYVHAEGLFHENEDYSSASAAATYLPAELSQEDEELEEDFLEGDHEK